MLGPKRSITDNTCQSQGKHMVIRVGLKEYSMDYQ